MRAFVILGALLWASFAFGSQSIHVEWGYTPPSEPAVTGYQLYQNGVARIVWQGAATVAGDVTLDALAFGDIFTLTALFDDSTESPHSAPYVWGGGSIIKFATLKKGNHPVPMNKPQGVRLR